MKQNQRYEPLHWYVGVNLVFFLIIHLSDRPMIFFCHRPTPCHSLTFLIYAVSCPTLRPSLVVLVSKQCPISLSYRLIPLFLNMERLHTVMFPLTGKQNPLKSFPYPLTNTLTPQRNINVPDLVDSNQSRAEIVKAKTTFNEISPPLHMLNLQRYPKSPKTPLQFSHTPLRSLTI